MIFKGLLNKGKSNGKGQPARESEYLGLLQVTTALKMQRHIHSIYEVVAREAARCLKSHRATVFVVEEGKGGLTPQYSCSSTPGDEKLGLLEEKEIARKAISEKRAFLLKDPEDFAAFFKYNERERKITSLLSVPFGPLGKTTGALSVTVINENRPFEEKDVQVLSLFANLASIAVQNHHTQ